LRLKTGQRGKGQEKSRLQPLAKLQRSILFTKILFVQFRFHRERAHGSGQGLWRKATETPHQITEEERRTVLRLVDLAAKIAQRIQNQWYDTQRTRKGSPHRCGNRRSSRVPLDSKWISHLGSFRTDGQQPHYLVLGGPDG
jgi:hypothetical protein